jgi:LDH2 family malate/lactate/ureidoglycolate dehydrogenase
VQILSCLLPGMPLDHELEHLDTGRFDQGRRIGHFLLALDPARFGDAARFEQMVAQLLRVVRATPAREGAEVLVPGDPQARCAALRARSGIPMSDEEAAALEREAQAVHAAHTAAPTAVVEDAAS